MIDLPALVQEVRINTGDLAAAEARAAAFGARFDAAGKQTQDRTEQIDASVQRLGQTGERALGQTEEGMRGVEQQSARTSDAVQHLGATGERSMGMLSNSELALRRAQLGLADAQERVASAQEKLNRLREDSATSDHDLTRAELDLVKAFQSSRVASEEVRKIHEHSTRDVDSHTGAVDRLTHGIDKLAKGFNPLSGLMSGLKIPAIVAALSLAVGAVGALTAGAGALIGALVPLTGAAAALPAVFFGLAGAVGVVKLALGGVGAAMKALGNTTDPTKIAAAFDKIPPAVRPLVVQLEKLKPQIDSIKEAAAEGLVPGLQAGIRSALPFIGTLRDGLRGIGQAVGDTARRFGQLAGSVSFRNNFAALAASSADFVRSAGAGAVAATRGLVALGAAAAPLTQWFGQLAQSAGETFDRWIEGARASGALTSFLDSTRNAMTLLGHALRDTGAALKNFFAAGSAAFGGSNTVLTAISNAAARMREWTESVAGKNRMAEFFSQAKPALTELGKLLSDIVGFMARLSGNQDLPKFISLIRTQLLPAIESLANGVTQRMGPALVYAAAAFLRFQNLLSFSPLISILEVFAKLAAGIFTVASKVPALGTVIASLLALRIAVRGLAFAGQVSGLTSLARSMFLIGPAGSAGLKGIAGFIQGLRGAAVVGSFANALGLITKGMLESVSVAAASTATWVANTAAKVANTVATLAQAAATRVATAAQWALNVAMDANPIGIAILAIAALAAGLYVLSTRSNSVAAIFTSIGHAFQRVGSFVADLVGSFGNLSTRMGRIATLVLALSGPLGALAAAILTVTRNWGTLTSTLGNVGGMFSSAWTAITGFVGRMFQAGVDIVDGIINGVRSRAAELGNSMVDLAKNFVEAPFKAFLGIFSPSRVMAEAGGEIPAGVAQGIRSGEGTVWDAMTDLANLAATAARTGADKVIAEMKRKAAEQAAQAKEQQAQFGAAAVSAYYDAALIAARKAAQPQAIEAALNQAMQQTNIFNPAARAPLTFLTGADVVSPAQIAAVNNRVQRLQNLYNNAATDVQRVFYDKQLQAAQAQQTRLQNLQNQAAVGSDPIGALRKRLRESARNATDLASAVHAFVKDGVSKPVLDQLLQLEQQAPGTLHSVVQHGMVRSLIDEATRSYNTVRNATKRQLGDAAIAGIRSAESDAKAASQHLADVIKANLLADIARAGKDMRPQLAQLLFPGTLLGIPDGPLAPKVVKPKSALDLLSIPTVPSVPSVPAPRVPQRATARTAAAGATHTETTYAPVFHFHGGIQAADLTDALTKAQRTASQAAVIGLDPVAAGGVYKAVLG